MNGVGELHSTTLEVTMDSFFSGVQLHFTIDLIYITRADRKILMVSKHGSFFTRDTMDEWCEKLPTLFFYLVHKSFLVNLHYVRKYSYSELILDDGTRIPIAPKKQAAFRKFWFAYLGGRQS